VPGQWIGRGAQTLRLRQGPQRGDLETLLSGRSPRTGEELAGGRGRKPSNAGFDLTFTAPKSVSVLLAVGDERVQAAVLAAHERGVRAGLDYLERHECFARRGVDGVDVIPAEGFVGAAYTHEMARSGDPHLHTHVVIANRVRAADGRWTAPDMRPVYAAAKTAGTIAEAVMREELTRSLGVRWHDVRNGTAEIDGVPPAVLKHFSQRHKEIADLALVRGWATERGIAEIQRETRDRKPQIDRDEARSQWQARSAEHGFSQEDLARVLHREPVQRTPLSALQLHRQLVGPNGLTRQESTFTRRALLRALAEAYPEGIAADEIERFADEIIARDGVRVTEQLGHEPPLYTTLDMVATEQRLLTLATATTRSSLTARRAVVEATIKLARGLGADQADAVRHLTSGAARTRLLEARAGYGKTATLRVVRQAYERSGVTVIGTTWQGQAAQTLERQAGIRSATTAQLLNQILREEKPIPRGAVLVVDEASMMPTRALTELAEEVAERNGRLILVYDRDQLPSMDAGGAAASLGDLLGSAHLAENRRQRDELQRQVAAHLAEGRAPAALALLTEHGRFQAYDDVREARADLIDAWAETSLRFPDRALILAHGRRDVAALNQLARERLDAAGLLGARRMTASGREWAAGDRLICRRNNYSPDIDVRNGTRATVTKVDQARSILHIRTDDGRTVRLPDDYLRHVEYGYASTGHASQGATVDYTYLLSKPARGGREWAYVAGSRHRIDLRVYTVHHDLDEARRELERTWQRSQAKRLAIDRMTPGTRERALRRAAERFPELLDVERPEPSRPKRAPRQQPPRDKKPHPLGRQSRAREDTLRKGRDREERERRERERDHRAQQEWEAKRKAREQRERADRDREERENRDDRSDDDERSR
jgi:conjugative relaxase-like TrwC/TraI family protein